MEDRRGMRRASRWEDGWVGRLEGCEGSGEVRTCG